MMKAMMIIQENISFKQVEAFKPKMIFYGANTCWWTHDPSHLGKTKSSEAAIKASAEMFRLNSGRPDAPLEEFLERSRRAHSNGLPCDPVGGVLFETDDVSGFLQAAKANFMHYGKHGLRAFMAAHHSNCFAAPIDKSNLLSIYEMPHFASQSWDDYNTALDRLDGTTNQL